MKLVQCPAGLAIQSQQNTVTIKEKLELTDRMKVAIGDQHDGHLPFWLPGFVKPNVLLLHVLFALLK